MEYRNMQDNIGSQEYNERSNSILEWIKENRDKYEWAKAPNAYEMTNLFLLGAKYGNEGRNINLDTLREMWEMRSEDFESVGIGNNNFVYRICQDAYNSAMKKKALVNDEGSHQALRKMAGIGLYILQQTRDGKTPEYNNPRELLELIEATRTLKGVHPDLFIKYRFMENIETLNGILPENSLSSRITDGINQLKQSRSVGRQESKTVKTEKGLEEK